MKTLKKLNFKTLAKIFSIVVITIFACKKDNPIEKNTTADDKLISNLELIKNPKGWKLDSVHVINYFNRDYDSHTTPHKCVKDDKHTFNNSGNLLIDKINKCTANGPDQIKLNYQVTSGQDSIIIEHNSSSTIYYSIDNITSKRMQLHYWLSYKLITEVYKTY